MALGGNETILLRYTYESLELLLADLHEEHGQPLLMFRAPSARIAAGRPVVVEFSFRTAEQYRLVTGVAGTHVAGEGTWLMLQRGSLDELRKSGLPTRKQRRLGCDDPVAVRRGAHTQVARMRDLSPCGARLIGVPALREGDQLVLARWGEGGLTELGPAEVVWSGRGEAGIAFDRRSDPCRLAVGKVFASLMQRWATAPEATRVWADVRRVHG